MSLRRNLISTLYSPPIRWINFDYQNRRISPIGFYLVANQIVANNINTQIDSSWPDRSAKYDPNSNTITANSNDFGGVYHDEKSVLVHEAAHAVLDVLFAGRVIKGNRIVQASPMRALDDEAIGFLAGAFYLVSAGAAGSSQLAPEREALKIARSKLKTKKQWTGTQTFGITPKEAQNMRTAVASDKRYKTTAKGFATHNG